MDKKQICSKFAREICTILQIEMPAIRFVSIDRLRTDTQIAALTPDGVLIRNDIGVTPELFFAIAHQQLGRALTAAGNFEPLVIDLVDNFEMIGIEQIVNMMSESYARLSDENDPKELIPPSAFKVIDHEKDARHLAKNLERRLALRSEKLTIDEKIALWKGL